MKFRNINFGNIFVYPGTFGYFGEEKSIFARFFSKKIVFVSKSVTVFPYKKEAVVRKTTIKNFWKNKNIENKLGAGVVVSREDISGVGLEALLDFGKWQKRRYPFFISIVLVGTTPEDRKNEVEKIIELFDKRKKEFKCPFGLIFCFDNPNDDDIDVFCDEINLFANMFSLLDVPVMPSVSLSFPPDALEKISANGNIDAIFVEPYVFWNQIPKDALKVFFQEEKSPILAKEGGSVFGKYVSPFSIEWVRQAKKSFVGKPLVVGGGVIGVKNVIDIILIGSNSIVLDRSVFLRFWNIGRIINKTNKMFYEKNHKKS